MVHCVNTLNIGVIRFRFTSLANCNFCWIAWINSKAYSGKDISNGYVTSLFWVAHFTECSVSSKSRKRIETADNLLRKINVIFFFLMTPRLSC